MKYYAFILMTVLILLGCKGAKNPDKVKPGSEVKTDYNVTVNAAGDSIEKLCFENVHPYKNPPPGYEHAADYDQLKITIDGDKAYGIYNWLPYEKDARRGSFVGTIKNNVITATYVYTQEEIYTGIAIEILLTDKSARVTSKELGSLEIAKTKCKEN